MSLAGNLACKRKITAQLHATALYFYFFINVATRDVCWKGDGENILCSVLLHEQDGEDKETEHFHHDVPCLRDIQTSTVSIGEDIWKEGRQAAAQNRN